MTPLTQTPALSTKATLARLMAAEDLKVEISQRARTASFNMMDRTLTLPLWDVADETFNMLVGHEVSHALYTPGGLALDKACRSISAKHPGVAKTYLNVVEDARIERLIKSDYPGLRKSFAEGYRELQAKNIFQTSGRDLSALSFIDRINIHYKCGWSMAKPVPFSAEELELVRRVATTVTWDDVVALSKDIYEFSKNKQQPEPEEEQQDEQQGGKGEQGESNESDEDESEGSEGSESDEGDDEGDDSEGSESDEGDEESDSEGSEGSTGFEGGGGDEEESEGSTGSEGEEGDEDEGSSSDGDEEGDETEGSSGSEGDEGDEGDAPAGGEADDDETAPPVAETDGAMADGLASMMSKATNRIETVDMPEWDREMVVPFATVEKVFSDNTPPATAQSVFKTFMDREGGNVQALWTEFERRKAADAYQRTEVSKTGRIDPLRMAYHKVSDDLFLSQELVRTGKNHGLFILLDMSGSMRDKIFGTMIQLANLAMFARRAQIPMVVYGFIGEGLPGKSLIGNTPVGYKGPQWENAGEHGANMRWGKKGATGTRLLTLLESGLSQTRFQKQVGSLLMWALGVTPKEERAIQEVAKAYKGYVSESEGVWIRLEKEGLRLASTPTNAALLMSATLVPEFQARHRLQVVNTVVMTDGESTDDLLRSVRVQNPETGLYEDTMIYLRDPVTRREYKAFKKSGTSYESLWSLSTREQQCLFAQILRDRTGTNLMSITLTLGKESSGIRSGLRLVRDLTGNEAIGHVAMDETVKKIIREKWAMVDSKYGYAKVAFLRIQKSDDEPVTLDSVSVEKGRRGASQLSKTFIKSLETRRTNRPLMSKLAEVMSKNLS